MRRRSFATSTCPIARSLDVVGEWWTFLILRNVVLGGPARFDDLRQGLGISPNVLSTRLARLVEEGILSRRRYSRRPPRDEYVATGKGEDLLPVLVALAAWGNRWAEGPPAVAELLHGTGPGHPLEPGLRCGVCSEPLDRDHIAKAPRP